jgi:hypothetical protein
VLALTRLKYNLCTQLMVNVDSGSQENDVDSSPGQSLNGSFRKTRSGWYLDYGMQFLRAVHLPSRL